MNQLPDILLNDEVTGRVINEIKLITDNNIEKINFILVKNLNMTIDDFKQVPDTPLTIKNRKIILKYNDLKKMLKWIVLKSQFNL